VTVCVRTPAMLALWLGCCAFFPRLFFRAPLASGSGMSSYVRLLKINRTQAAEREILRRGRTPAGSLPQVARAEMIRTWHLLGTLCCCPWRRKIKKIRDAVFPGQQPELISADQEPQGEPLSSCSIPSPTTLDISTSRHRCRVYVQHL